MCNSYISLSRKVDQAVLLTPLAESLEHVGKRAYAISGLSERSLKLILLV